MSYNDFHYTYTETVYKTTDKSTEIPVKVRKPADAPVAPDSEDITADTYEASADAPTGPEAPQATGPSAREGELEADLQRLQAEYVNYRKRVDRDRHVAGDLAVQSTIEKLIPVLDDITAARKFGDLTDGPFAAIANKLENTLGALGLERINTVDVEFDPTIHEGVLRQPSDTIAENNVSEVFREGFKVGDRVIRAAQVMISAGSN